MWIVSGFEDASSTHRRTVFSPGMPIAEIPNLPRIFSIFFTYLLLRPMSSLIGRSV
jgi:hypothetical protein